MALSAHYLLAFSIFGRWLDAIGHNLRAALVSGVPVGRVILIAYVLCAVCAAVASIIYTGRLETGTPVLGQRVLTRRAPSKHSMRLRRKAAEWDDQFLEDLVRA